MKEILETGRWWEDAWWEGNQFALNQPVEDVRRAVGVLRDLFTATWVLQKLASDPDHPIIDKLCHERGTRSARFLVSVAELFSLLSPASGFPQKFADLIGEKYHATRLELDTAAVLVQAGLTVEFPPEGADKSPDILSRDAETIVAIECKRLEEQQWEKLASTLMMQMIKGFPGARDGQEIVVQAALDEGLSEILMGPSYDDLNQAIIEEVCARFQKAISAALATNTLPARFDLAGIGKAAVLAKEEGVWGEIRGMPISRVAKLRRTLQNGLFRAIEQLPGSVPGIAVIHTDFAPDLGLARAVFDAITRARRESYRCLVAMIIIPRMDGHLPGSRMMLVNSNTDFAEKRFRALDALREGFGLRAI